MQRNIFTSLVLSITTLSR